MLLILILFLFFRSILGIGGEGCNDESWSRKRGSGFLSIERVTQSIQHKGGRQVHVHVRVHVGLTLPYLTISDSRCISGRVLVHTYIYIHRIPSYLPSANPYLTLYIHHTYRILSVPFYFFSFLFFSLALI